MVELKVYRNGRCSTEDVKNAVQTVWNGNDDNVVKKYSTGVVTASPETISNSLLLIQDAYGGSLNVKVHCCELSFGKDIAQEKVLETTKEFLDYVGTDYQGIAVVEEDISGLKSKLLINAMSYVDGKKFTDNNKTYIQLGNVVRGICGQEMRLKMDESVLFKNTNNNKSNYITLTNTSGGN